MTDGQTIFVIICLCIVIPGLLWQMAYGYVGTDEEQEYNGSDLHEGYPS